MKEKAIKIDLLKGFNLLSRILRLFPYEKGIPEMYLNQERKSSISRVWKLFWEGYVFDTLDKEGYYIQFDFRYHRDYDINTFNQDILSITKKVFEYLEQIETHPRNNIYTMNREFISLRILFKTLFNILALKDNEGGWKQLLSEKDDEVATIFYNIVGFFRYDYTDYILTSEDFCKIVNEILKVSGYEAFSLSRDGILRYFGITAEAEQKKRAYNLLNNKKYGNVINELDNIYDCIVSGKYPDGLGNCRKALESFYKRFLINHGITTLNNGNNTEDGTIVPLAETIKQNIPNLFTFPTYSRNLDTQGYKNLIESSKFIISGMANQAGSHGKSSPPKVNLDDVKVAESFLVMLINTILPFEKL